ncbi:MAG: eukaryotic-like serine/threonine-protein kinase [Acidobacteriota bacterium]|jgi:serine/threonine protein kinase
MDRELWKQVDALLEQALEQPPEAREAFVAVSAQGNPVLRDEVLSLLKAQSQAANFMERSAMKVAAHALAQDSRITTIVSTLVGQEIATYKIEKLLGAGGMGEVYLARDLKLGRLVALKVLPLPFVVDADRLSRFQREARALSSLNHPNLVTIYEVGEANGFHFIAMELVEGKTLSSLRDKLSLKELLAIVAQVAEALGAAHQSGIIHRDVKPDNVMVRPDGYAKVLDFGLVKLAEVELTPGTAAQTQLGMAMGTLAYMSPEQAAGEPVDHRTDIWSLGVVLYELSTGQKPFTGESRQAIINRILSGEPSPIDAGLPLELDTILSKALEKDRELRYQTASDFRADIRRLLRQIDSLPGGSGAQVAKPFMRPRWLWPVVTGVLILTTAFLAWSVWMRAKTVTTDWSRAAHLQLTNEHGTEYFPSLAPDGKSFVYASKQNGSFDLFVQRVGGKNATSLTPNTPSDEIAPVFSPNGERIAFRSTREPAGVYVMEAGGENVRLVVAGCHHPSWSPDGREIVCSTAGHDEPATRNTVPSALWIANVETGDKRFLCEHDAMQPSWSPSGDRIAFWFMPPSAGRSDIATISRTGGEIEVVTKDASTNWNPVWSPDGKFLYFASDRSGNMSFWRVAIDEKSGKVQEEAEAVSTPANFNRHLSFSANGRRMIYVQTDQQSNIQALNFNANTEKVTGQPFWITRGDRHIVRPEISPDGTRFVMRVSRRTQDDIVVVSRDGTQWRDLTNDKPFDRYPRWSPDGRKIAFTSDRSGRYEIWILDADATNLRQVTFDTAGDTTFPIWSPDGTQILFRGNFVNTILDVNKTWTEQELRTLPMPSDNQRFVAWDWSPDGKRVIGNLSGPPSVVAMYSVETKQYEKLAEFASNAMWLPDSTRFVFIFDKKIYLGDVKTKRVREIFSSGENEIRSVDISADGKLLYYSVYSSESDIWLLDLE